MKLTDEEIQRVMNTADHDAIEYRELNLSPAQIAELAEDQAAYRYINCPSDNPIIAEQRDVYANVFRAMAKPYPATGE